MKKATLLLMLATLGATITNAQVRYFRKMEIGGQLFNHYTQALPTDPNGYFIPHRENALGFDLVNGVIWKDCYYAGFGIGYQDFQGTEGITLYVDLDYSPFQGKWRPFLDGKIGYSRLMNNYNRGTGSLYAEGGIGIAYQVSNKYQIYLQSGITSMQQAVLFPLRLGLRF